MTLLLASASPARRRLLELAAIPHRVQVSGVDEEAITDPSPAVLVQKLAQAKAQAVLERLAADEKPAWGVLGCDSVLEFEGQIFGKPADADQAIARWQCMAGRSAEPEQQPDASRQHHEAEWNPLLGSRAGFRDWR